MDIGFTITGTNSVTQRFEDIPVRLYDRLVGRVTQLTDELEGRVRGAAPKLTGKLEGEIVSQVFDNPDRVVGRVTLSGEYAKAAALEYGAHGTTNVSAHEVELSTVFGRRLTAPLTVMIAAHSRRLNIAQQSFLRPSIAGMNNSIVEGLRDAVNETIE